MTFWFILGFLVGALITQIVNSIGNIRRLSESPPAPTEADDIVLISIDQILQTPITYGERRFWEWERTNRRLVIRGLPVLRNPYREHYDRACLENLKKELQ